MPITVPQDEVTLLSYFKTGDKPTQDQYEELIRTFFYLLQVANDNAQDAIDIANALAPRTALAMASAVHPGVGTTYTIENDFNVASIVTLTGPSRIRITFDTALAGTDYIVQVTPFTGTANPDQIQLITRGTTFCDIAIYDGASFLSQVRFSISIFRAS